jgi:hypothetical protein
VARADRAQAEELVGRARKLIEQGYHRAAVEMLERAVAADPSPDLQLELAGEYERLALAGDDRRDIRLALASFQQYLLARKAVPPEGSIESRIAALRERLESLGPEQPGGVAPVAEPARPGKVRVDFIADRPNESFHVIVGQGSCETPCSMQLTSGAHLLSLDGADRLQLSMYVPVAPGTVRLVRSGNRFLVPGVLLTIAGVIIGASMWAVGADCGFAESAASISCETANFALWPTLGAAMFATGVGFLSYSTSHQISKVDVDVETPPAETKGQGVKLSSIGFQPQRGGGTMGLGLAF